MCNAFWARVTELLNASVFGRWFIHIATSVGASFKQSHLYNFFVSKDMSDVADASKIPNIIRKFFFDSWFSQMLRKSSIMRLVCNFSELIFSSKVSVVSFFLVPAALLILISNFKNTLYIVACVVIILLCVYLAKFKGTFGTAIQSSFLLGGICRFFDIKLDFETENKHKSIYVFSVLFGVLIGACSFIFDATIALLMMIAFAIMPFLLACPILLLTLTVLGGVLFSTLPAFALSVLAFIVVVCRLYFGKERLPKLRPMYIFTALYAVVILYHMFNGFGGSDSIVAAMIQFSLLLIFFSVVIVINTKDKFVKFIKSISIMTIPVCLCGIYQYLAGQGGIGWSDNAAYGGGLKRIVGTFNNPNIFAEYLVVVMCITVVSLFLSDTNRQRFIFFICLVLQFINLLFTYSRGCYIALLIAAVITIWCFDKRFLGFGIFALPFIPYVLPKNILTRIASVGSFLKDSSVSYRFKIWEGSLKVIKNHWFIGAGVGTAAFSAFYKSYMLPEIVAEHSHNWFVQITIELSVIALFVMLLIFIYSLKDVCFTVKNNSDIKHKAMLVPLVAAIAGMIFEGLVDHVFYNNIIFMLFWLVIALLNAGLNICDKECNDEKL